MSQPHPPAEKPDIAVNVRLANIRPDDVAEASDVPDAKTFVEKEKWDDAKRRAELDNYTQRTELVKKYAHRIFCLSCTWLAAVFAVLLLQGFNGIYHIGKFSLQTSVILVMIGTTTFNVIGIFYVVTHYLFPSAEGNKINPVESNINADKE